MINNPLTTFNQGKMVTSNNPLRRPGAGQVESRWDCVFFTSKEWETAGQRRAVRAWPWPQGSAKPIPIGKQSTRLCQKNIAFSIRSMHLRRSAGQIYVMQWFVCAGSPNNQGGQ